MSRTPNTPHTHIHTPRHHPSSQRSQWVSLSPAGIRGEVVKLKRRELSGQAQVPAAGRFHRTLSWIRIVRQPGQ